MNTLKNTVSLIGRLGMDPEVTKFESGSMLARFSLATSDSYKDKNGEWVDNTEWHNIVAWGKSAELVKDKLQKGTEIALEGKLEHDSYTTKEGEKRTKTQIKMREFIIINRVKNKQEKAA
jgi:single-strand DNA-binding protein